MRVRKPGLWPVFLLLGTVLLVLVVIGLKNQQSKYPDWVTPAWYTFTQKTEEGTLALDLWGNRTPDGTEVKVHFSHGGPNQKWGVLPIPGTSWVHLQTAQGKCIGAEGNLLRQEDCSKAVKFVVRTRTTQGGETEVQFVDGQGKVAGLLAAEPAADFTLGTDRNNWWSVQRVWGTGPHFPMLEYIYTPWGVVAALVWAACMVLWFLKECWNKMPRGFARQPERKTSSRMVEPFFWMALVLLCMVVAYLLELLPRDVTTAMWGKKLQGFFQYALTATVLNVVLTYTGFTEPYKQVLWKALRVGFPIVLALFVLNPFDWMHSSTDLTKGHVPPIYDFHIETKLGWDVIGNLRVTLQYFAFALIFYNQQFIAPFFRRQALWITSALFVPVALGWAAWKFTLIPLQGVDGGYVVWVVTAAAMLPVLRRWRIFEALPGPAESRVVRHIQPTIITDADGIITWMSPQAQLLFPGQFHRMPLALKDASELNDLILALQNKHNDTQRAFQEDPSRTTDPEDLVVAFSFQNNLHFVRLLEGQEQLNDQHAGTVYSFTLVTDEIQAIRKQKETQVQLEKALAERDEAIVNLKTANADLSTAHLQAETISRNLEVQNKVLEGQRLLLESQKQELEVLHREVARQAITDHLTQWKNRQGFADDWKVLSRAVSSEDGFEPQVACIYFDIDNFRTFNQANHLVGDAVLREVTGHVLNQLNDLLGDSPFMAYRMSGEEFCVLLPEVDLQAAVDLAELVRETLDSRAFEVRVAEAQYVFNVTASFGVAATPEHVLETLLLRADAAAAEAKLRGKNRVIEHPYLTVGWDH